MVTPASRCASSPSGTATPTWLASWRRVLDDEEDEDDELFDDDEDEGMPLLLRPHDLTDQSRRDFVNSHEDGMIAYPAPLEVYTDKQEAGFKYAVAHSAIQLSEGGFIIGKGRCRSFDFPPVTPADLACDLAVNDAHDKYWRWLRGLIPSANEEQFDALKRETRDWTERRWKFAPGMRRRRAT